MTLYKLNSAKPETPAEGTYWIAPSASVIGNVKLESFSSVWFGAVVRGDNETIVIGENTNVQDNAVLHSDPGSPLTIGAGCTIGHGAIVHGCTLGTNTLVGMGATVLNGAVVGKNCLIGANALVTENTIVPDNSLVLGAPAKVVKQLDDKTIKSLEASAQIYVKNWQTFANKLAKI